MVKEIMKKLITTLALGALATLSVVGQEKEAQNICPIMIETEIDLDEVVEFEGKEVFLCCGGCTRAWEASPLYYFKIGRELKLLPQFETISAELQAKLDKIEYMEQRFCTIKKEAIVHPKSPFVEYEGKKIYFFSKRDIDRKWKGKEKQYFDDARKAGLLPQFDQKK